MKDVRYNPPVVNRMWNIGNVTELLTSRLAASQKSKRDRNQMRPDERKNKLKIY